MDSITAKHNTPILNVENMSVTFGRLKAVDGIDFQIYKNELFGLIGPNGAGKTTIFNAITNTVPLSSGTVRFGEHDIHGMKPHKVAELGVVRIFQSATVFPKIPVQVHIMNGLHCRTSATVWGGLLRTPFTKREEAASRKRAQELIKFTDLEGLDDQPAGGISWAQQKRLMLATALAAEPTLILLDEPVAGMNSEEIAEMIELIRSIRKQGITVFIIDHNMKVMMNLCDRIMVMNFGKKLTEGAPAEISKDPRVIQAYLGYSHK